MITPVLASLGFVAPSATALGQSARVVVSQRELRVEFPRDTAGRWRGFKSALWQLNVEDFSATGILELQVSPNADQRPFPSLERMVAAGSLELCGVGGARGCTRAQTASAFVERGSVVLRLRDSSAIATMFALRPATAQLVVAVPGKRTAELVTSVAVTYADPQVPAPDTARVAAASKALTTKYGPPRWAARGIDGGERRGNSLALSVGDSATLVVNDTTCRWDMCISTMLMSDSRWAVDDTMIATIAVSPTDSARTGDRASGVRGIVRARRAGQTVIRVMLPVPVRENIPGADSAGTTIRLHVVVSP